MFRWYKNSEICYAYLSDTKDGTITKSSWWSRGWTLQELLAPKTVIFYSKSWEQLGTKGSFARQISQSTGIDERALEKFDPDDWSVAQRMSWASQRETSRKEDTAYSLMGLFGVNMPLLYGEGPAAFIRLQEEIIKKTDDQSIFAYTEVAGIEKYGAKRLFAESPKSFDGRGHVRLLPVSFTERSYAMTNKGLHIELPLIKCPPWLATRLDLKVPPGNEAYEAKVAILACSKNASDMYYGIILQPTEIPSVFDRVGYDPFHVTPSEALAARTTQLYIRRKGLPISLSALSGVIKQFSIVVDCEQLKKLGYILVRAKSLYSDWSSFDETASTLSGTSADTLPAVVVFFNCESRIVIPIIISAERTVKQHSEAQPKKRTDDYTTRAFLQVLDIQKIASEVDFSPILDSIVNNARPEENGSATTIGAARIRIGSESAFSARGSRYCETLELIASICTEDMKLNREILNLSVKAEKILTSTPLLSTPNIFARQPGVVPTMIAKV
jgi:hypothetical protein